MSNGLFIGLAGVRIEDKKDRLGAAAHRQSPEPQIGIDGILFHALKAGDMLNGFTCELGQVGQHLYVVDVKAILDVLGQRHIFPFL